MGVIAIPDRTCRSYSLTLCFQFSAVVSRNLRSYVGKLDEEPAAVVATAVENTMFSSLNQTPGVQRVEQPDSETAANSNSSSDFPNAAQQDLKPSSNLAPEGHWDTAAPPVVYEGSKAKENWIDPKPTSVILQQHRSDEM